MEEKNTYQYTYSASTNKEVEQIRKKYLPQEKDKLSELKRMDMKVQYAGTAESLAVGVIGCLIFGIGMSIGLGAIGGTKVLAVVLGIIGIVVMLPAYPVYLKVSRKVKAEYAPRILELADEIQMGK